MAEQTSSGAYIGLARRYRPQSFADLVGQDQIARSLAQQVMAGKVAQAYIFSGPRGIGKTSTARILAKSLNCLSADGPTATPCGTCEQCRAITSGNSMDVIEIDGASNNSVDDVRELQETVNQNPFSARKKIYIIDEVHMLSRGAFNALLKTLEEPPPFVVFVFATTEFEKIPETIKSRCQAFQFSRISIDDLIKRLDYVADAESMDIDPGERRAIFETIAYAVDGGMRDAMMALDQLRALSEGAIRLDETTRFLGMVEHDLLIRTVEMIHGRDAAGLLQMINGLVERGRDLERFVKNLLSFLRDLMVLKAQGGEELVSLSGEKLARARELLWSEDEQGRREEVLTYPALLNVLNVFMDLEARMKQAVQVRILLEFAVVKLTAVQPVVDIANLLKNFDRIGKNPAPRREAPPAPAQATAAPRREAPPREEAPRAERPASPPAEAPVEAPAEPKPDTPDLFGGGARRSAPEANLGAAGVWDALMRERQSLGMQLSLALNDCAPGDLTEEAFELLIDRKSLSRRALESPDGSHKIESLLEEILGRRLKLRVRATQKTPPAKAPVAPLETSPAFYDSAPEPPESSPAFYDSAPEPSAPPEAFEEPPPVSDAETATALYLAQHPDKQARHALKQDPRFREQVEAVRRFFDGRLFDAAGKEILL